jgi:formate dehydrogenase subunit gamma
MTPPPERRFSRAEILVHAAFATLVLIAIASAACLWYDPLAELIGRRYLVTKVHIVVGLLLPVPLLLGLLSAQLRRDVRTLERLTDDDRDWLRSPDRRSGRIHVERFNAGQKLNSAFTLGAVLVLLGTGMIMGSVLWSWPTHYRIGASWVHDWAALGLTIAVVGHVYFVIMHGRGDASNDLSISEPTERGTR